MQSLSEPQLLAGPPYPEQSPGAAGARHWLSSSRWLIGVSREEEEEDAEEEDEEEEDEEEEELLATELTETAWLEVLGTLGVLEALAPGLVEPELEGADETELARVWLDEGLLDALDPPPRLLAMELEASDASVGS